MKKIITALLILTVATTLVACGKKTDKKNTEETQETTDGRTIEEVSISVLDNDTVSFDITSYEYNAVGYILTADITNKSEHPIMLGMEDVYVNDLLCDPLWAEEIPAGETISSEIYFSDLHGITQVSDIDFTLAAYNTDEDFEGYVVEEDCSINPENIDKITYQRDISGDTLLWNGDTVKVYLMEAAFAEDGSLDAKLYLYNCADGKICLSLADATVGGVDANPGFAAYLNSGKQAFANISWSAEELSSLGITDAGEVALYFVSYDATSSDLAELEEIITSFNL